MQFALFFIFIALMYGGHCIKLAPEIYSNKLTFPYGVNFKYTGVLHHNLARVWIVTKFPMPKWENYDFPDIEFLPDCNFRITEKPSPAWTHKNSYMTSWLIVMCEAVSPQLQLIKTKERFYKAEVLKKIDNLHEAILALVSAGRNKRFAAALSAIAGLVTLAVESISGYLQAKGNKAMANALNAMKESQMEHNNRLNRYNNELLLYSKFSMNSTEEMIEALQDMYSQQSFVEKIVRNLTLDWPTRYLSKPAVVALYATYLHALTEKYNTLYRELIYNLDRLLKATHYLSKRRIPTELIPPDMLEMFDEDVMKKLRLTHPAYTLALPDISYYLFNT